MSMRLAAWRKASSGFNTPLGKDLNSKLSLDQSHGPRTASLRCATPANGGGTPVIFASSYGSTSGSQQQKKSLDRDFFVSVLETSVTKRDAKAYMNKFVPLLEKKGATDFKQRAAQPLQDTNSIAPESMGLKDTINHVALNKKTTSGPETEEELAIQEYVALVKFRAPEMVNDATMNGVGKTLSQLRKLGLISIVVVDCESTREDVATQRQAASMQANRISMAVDNFDALGARVIDSPIMIGNPVNPAASPFVTRDLYIANPSDLMTTLQDEVIPIIPSFGYTADTCTIKPVKADDIMLALTRQLSGLQFLDQATPDDARTTRLSRAAEVYRIVVLDPLGGIPATNRATGRHLFLNLEQEFEEVKKDLEASLPWTYDTVDGKHRDNLQHLENAELVKNILSLLPPTSSAVITTPQEVAKEQLEKEWAPLVETRRGQNPLIHSLLTDKPVQSSSLPSERFRPVTSSTGTSQIGSLTTLAKRGMPLTIFPDPRVTPWKAPQPGQKSLKLTDPCIDLPRLVKLIEDSFGRKLDVDDYLRRVDDNLAGIIIAGEYEGGALLTWEKPAGMEDTEARNSNRLIPYLDKFAVLRKSQGAGGVADIVFNAMVRDCFPEGVCWRSRKDNPVNKWYFERSRGSLKFKDMNWTMFWTTPELALDERKFRDYESVCRGVEPSWADKKHIVD
ncbi:Uu.00g023550.m01.CDS01 [Anthostomella pinea]|uniref:Amino-acid acetyltransferase, mitochondrial n=1 Tax=Anthostomella pinea TaxID=933095 RepID=A0AAI8W025_9PEZI|nr:Uu.00g023550.m01.CDS01 [Anthostomella pinea]